MIYFAYGSNMSFRRLHERVRSAKPLSVGTLRHHKLAFHKVSTKDGSGKCDIVASAGDDVMGVLFEIDSFEKPRLDRFEGLGYGYDEKEVQILTDDGQSVYAFTYYATTIDSALKPFTWYIRHMFEGAKEAGLPQDYVAKLEKVESIKDHDLARERKELRIYEG